MNCPNCGATVKDDNICHVCGKKTAPSGQEVEIEYKEFKVSEFLEIRRKQEGSRSGTIAEFPRKNGNNTLKSRGKPPAEPHNENTGILRGKDHSSKGARNILFLIVIVVAIAAIMAGAFYLPHLFSQH